MAVAQHRILYKKRQNCRLIQIVLNPVENIVGKGEDAGYQHFLLSFTVFKSLFHRDVESRDCFEKG